MNPNGMASFTGLSHAIGRPRRSRQGTALPTISVYGRLLGIRRRPPQQGRFAGSSAIHQPSSQSLSNMTILTKICTT